jgi:hypothetical protein
VPQEPPVLSSPGHPGSQPRQRGVTTSSGPVRQYVHMVTPEDESRSQRFRVPEGADLKAANADSVTLIPPPRSAIPTTRNMLRAGLVTGVTAAIVCSMAAFVGWIFRVDFLVSPSFTADNDLVPLPWISVALVPLIAGLVGSLAAAALLGVRRARKLVLVFGTLIAILSLAAPLLQPNTVTWPTKLWLVLMHIEAWLIIVPQVARVVGDSDPLIVASFREETDGGLA